MRDWKKTFDDLSEDNKDKLAILRVMECSNGVIQYSFRDGDPWALSPEETRKAMQFSMGCIKRMEIPLGETTITFDEDTAAIFREVRELYMSGAKRGNDDDYQEFMKVSIIMMNCLGKERIIRAKEILSNNITEEQFPKDKLQWGVDYMLQYIR